MSIIICTNYSVEIRLPYIMMKKEDCIRKLNEFLYVQEYIPGDLFFVMERVDDAVPDLRKERETTFSFRRSGTDIPLTKIQFWKDFAEEEGRHLQEIAKGGPSISAGIVAFRKGLDFHVANQLWIVYASLREITDLDTVQPEDIELYMTTKTTEEAPMMSNMGIQRASRYFKRDDRRHSRLSMPLHSFSAKVMLRMYPEKLYMINAAVANMRRLIEISDCGN